MIPITEIHTSIRMTTKDGAEIFGRTALKLRGGWAARRLLRLISGSMDSYDTNTALSDKIR